MFKKNGWGDIIYFLINLINIYNLIFFLIFKYMYIVVILMKNFFDNK